MNKKSKLISGLAETKTKRTKRRFFSISQKHEIINDYLTSGETKQFIWRKHTGSNYSHGIITKWLRSFGYGDISKKSNKFARNYTYMKKRYL